jgi:hypothetical protein
MKKILGIFLLFSIFISWVWAQLNPVQWVTNDWPSIMPIKKVVKEYPNSAEFLKAEGNICESATDWCNLVSIVNGELWAMTMMYCEDIYGEKWHEKWSCTKYIEPIVTDENNVCTMDYNPVCAVVQVQCIKAPCYPIQQTFWNACSAWKNKILYKWECNTSVNMALYNRYTKWQAELQKKLEKIPTETLSKVVELINELIPKTKMLKIIDSIIKQRVTKYVFLKNLIQEELSNRQ